MDALVIRENAALIERAQNLPAPGQSAIAAIEQHKQTSNIQAALALAASRPRNENQAFARIMESCKRPTFAKEAMYAYPRGKELVTGASIRMAEMLSRCWGNIHTESNEVARYEDHSDVIVFAWDLETNYQDCKSFVVPHVIDTKFGPKKPRDTRDIDELILNKAARRKRACILSVIPGDVVDAAIEQCEKTLASGTGGPLIDRIRQMVVSFAEIGVNQDALEKRLNHKIDVTIEAEMVTLQKIFRSLRDGMGKREDFFDIEAKEKGNASNINEAITTIKTTPDKQ